MASVEAFSSPSAAGGILIGAAIYSEVYPYIAGNLLELGGFGKLTLPSLLGVNHWLVIVPLAVLMAVMLRWVDRKRV